MVTTTNHAHPSVEDQVADVLANIKRRAATQQEDIERHVLLEQRLISGTLSEVKGLQKHLAHAKLKKAWYEQQEVRDHLGHDTISRAKLHKQYSL